MTVGLPREASTVGLVRATLSDILRALGVDQACVDDIRLAVSEACTNVIAHASSDDDYEIQVHLDERACVIDVCNRGQGFDASSLHDGMPNPESAHGRGVAIMHAVMDNTALRSEPESGTIVHLVRALSLRPDSPLRHVTQRR